jgi:hypothetical protein
LAAVAIGARKYMIDFPDVMVVRGRGIITAMTATS